MSTSVVERPPASPRRAAPLLRVYPALGLPTFRLLWLGMLPSNIAWTMSTVATGYAAFILTESATVLGLVSVAMGVPMLLFSLVGGVVADRLPRRTVLIATQSAFGLATAAVTVLALSERLAVWHLVAFTFVQGAAVSFNMPSRQAYIAELVGPRLLRSAVALNNAGLNFCRIAGPAIAGAMLAVPAIGVGGVFLSMTVMYAAVLVSLFRLPTVKDASAPPREAGGWAQLVEGLQYIRSSPVLLALLGLAFVPLFFGMPYQMLMPVFAERVFEVGAAGLGTLMAAAGVGALAGSLFVAAVTHHARPALFQLALGVAFGLGLVGFALAPAFAVAVACLVVVGFASASYTALNNTLLLSNTEPRLYGRVMSIYMFTFAVMPLGTMPAAWFADHIGGRATVAAGGLIVAAAVVAVALLYRPYRHIR
ncbi:MAG TPA: MFS transporter [Chloroflexota bacterium]|nr:MFS transporter [Chloroflexota bacterium]